MANYFTFLSFLICLIGIVNCKLNCDCVPNLDNRIVGGTRTGKHEFGWQISLGLKRNGVFQNHICGGTILNEQYILTASHCVYGYKDESDYLIGFGSNDLEEMTIDKRIPAEQIIIHPLYQANRADSKGDIALIRLARPLNLTDEVKPACLLKDMGDLDDILDNQPDQIYTASGFGSVTRTYKWLIGRLRGGKIERYMKKADFKHSQDNEKGNQCRGRDDLICIKPVDKNNKDSICNGDSGGPLQFIFTTNSTNGQQINKMPVIGVTSFGAGDISRPLPLWVTFCNGNAAYTKCAYYNDFITSHIKEDDLCMI